VNYYRYIEEVYVIPSQGPYIVFNDVTINDSLGNNNGMINPGEAVLLSITLENVGFNPGVNIEATINTVEVYVSIIDSTENYGNIPPGLTSLVNNGFLIELTDNCPNDYILQFTINIADGDSNWISDFSLYTYPDIEITLEPHNMPIIIPCNGGSFSFDASIRNNGTSPANFSAWSAVILPDSTEFGPILTRLGINLASGDSISRDNINQNVPANAPAGIYYYGVYVGNDIGEALFEDGFEFEKSSTEIGRKGENSWNISGWETGDISSILVIPEDPVFNYNYPNPFNAETRFNFSLPEDMRISLAIYNIQGQDVAILLDEICPAGYHSIKFDGSQLANGIYFARFISDYGQKTVKLLLIK
jgi:hypothetical protein